MSPDLSLLALLLNASLLVQGVLVVLLLASIISWTIIFDRAWVLRRARQAAQSFEARFWSGGDLGELDQELGHESAEPTGMQGIFRAGFRAFMQLREQDEHDTPAMIQASERAMRVALSRELDRLERHLALLATIGSTSPYIGLFGTVWGIMQAFHALGNVDQATLALVAPGISEALVATAFGLFAAIPAVIAYNRYADQVDRLGNRFDEFSDEFLALLQRQARV